LRTLGERPVLGAFLDDPRKRERQNRNSGPEAEIGPVSESCVSGTRPCKKRQGCDRACDGSNQERWDGRRPEQQPEEPCELDVPHTETTAREQCEAEKKSKDRRAGKQRLGQLGCGEDDPQENNREACGPDEDVRDPSGAKIDRCDHHQQGFSRSPAQGVRARA
jgi:hypothetical protein